MVERGQDHQLATQAQVDSILLEEMTLEEDILDKEVILLGGHILHQGKITLHHQWSPTTKPDPNTIPKLSLRVSSKNTLTILQA